MKAQSGFTGRALSLHNLGCQREWVVSITPWPLYPGRDPVPIVSSAGLAPRPVELSEENLAPNRGLNPGRSKQ
jgi:hypothetical protein